MKGKALLFMRVTGVVMTLSASMQAHSAPAAPVVVCYPGGPVSETEANTAMGAMLRVVERIGEWPANSFTSFFTAQAEECRTLLNRHKPAFSITSLGLFLEQRDGHHLIPIAQPRMAGAASERFRIVAQKGKFTSLESLKGKSLGGTVFEEPAFIQKIVFAGKLEPESFFSLKPSRQAIRTLRSLDKGELDAVLLNGQQYAALSSLPLKTPLDTVFISDEIPLMGLVADSTQSSAEDRARFAKALQGMCADTDGRKLCELFGIEAFVPANPAAIDPMITRWKQGK